MNLRFLMIIILIESLFDLTFVIFPLWKNGTFTPQYVRSDNIIQFLHVYVPLLMLVYSTYGMSIIAMFMCLCFFFVATHSLQLTSILDFVIF